MVVYGPASAPPAYPFAPTDTADSVNHGSDLHAIDRQEIRALWTQMWVQERSRLIVNGNYDHWQRAEAVGQVCPTTFNANTSFQADRMFTLPAGATVTVTRDGATLPDAKSRFSLAISGAASVTTVDHGQRIRSAYRTRYKQSLTFSLWVLNVSGAPYTPTLRVDTPAAADDWTTPTNRLAQTLQSCPDSLWTRVSHTFDPSAYTNINNGLSVYLRIPSGSSVLGDVTWVSQFRLEPSAGMLPYLAPDPDEELLRCLAYYRKSYSDGVVPGTNTAVGLAGGGFFASGGQNAYSYVVFGRPMWKIPTISLWGKAGVANQFWNPVTAVDSNTSQAANISTNGFTLQNATTASEIVQAHYAATAELT